MLLMNNVESGWQTFSNILPAYDVITSTPAPEPTGLALFASGIIGIVAGRLRRSSGLMLKHRLYASDAGVLGSLT